MPKIRKLLSTVAAIALAGGVAYATNIPLLSGPAPSEPSQTLATFNQLISSINSGTPGLGGYGGWVGNIGNVGTTASQILAQSIIPTGSISGAGTGFRATCAGIMASNATNETVAIQVGNTVADTISLSTITVGQPWSLDMLWQAATSPVTASYVFVGHGFSAPATGSATNFVSVNAGQDTVVTNNSVNFSIPIKCVAVMNSTQAGILTATTFTVEQVK
jgi:hypothetical protein